MPNFHYWFHFATKQMLYELQKELFCLQRNQINPKNLNTKSQGSVFSEKPVINIIIENNSFRQTSEHK